MLGHRIRRPRRGNADGLPRGASVALSHLPAHGGGHHPAGPTTVDTFTGRTIDLADPEPAAVSVADIAHGLSNACRFMGQPSAFYSVAEHSCLVHDLVAAGRPGTSIAAAALLHDGHEAYLGDVVTPLKPLIGPAYAQLAERMDGAIAAATALDPAEFSDRAIKAADAWALIIEARRLMPSEGWGWTRFADVPDLPAGIVWAGGLLPEQAEREFLLRWARLAALGVGICR